jgi:hypothetical protein
LTSTDFERGVRFKRKTIRTRFLSFERRIKQFERKVGELNATRRFSFMTRAAYSRPSEEQGSNPSSQEARTGRRSSHRPLKFTPYEDALLMAIIQRIGDGDWTQVAQLMSSRNARQCRERWTNYLSPDLRVGNWTEQEDRLLREMVGRIGMKWNQIAQCFQNRSANCLRNHWGALSHPTRNATRAWRPNRAPEVITPQPRVPEQFGDSRDLMEDLFPQEGNEAFKDLFESEWA